MKWILNACVALIVSLPLFAFANSIQSTTISSADSGGGSDASAEVKTRTQSGSGNVRVDVETTSDGIIQQRSFTGNGEEGIDIEIATSSHSRGAAADAKTRIMIGGATSSRERMPRPPRPASGTSSNATSSGLLDFPFLSHATGTRAASRLENLLKRLFNFLGFF